MPVVPCLCEGVLLCVYWLPLTSWYAGHFTDPEHPEQPGQSQGLSLSFVIYPITYIYMIISYIIICAISNVSYSFTLSWMTFIGSQTVGQVGQVGYILTSHNSVDSGRRLLALDGLGWPEHMPYMPQDARWTGGSSLSVQNRRTPATSGNQFDQFDPVWPPLNCVWYRFSLHNSWYCNSCLHD